MSRMDIFDTAGDAQWDFVGNCLFTDDATNAGSAFFAVEDNSSAGAPTYALGNTGGGIGEFTFTLAATSEVEVLTLYQSDRLQFDIDNMIRFEARVKMGQAALTSGSKFYIGMGSAVSANPNVVTDMTAYAAFSITGATSTTLVYAETDDNVTDTAPVSTGKTLINAYKTLAIDFSASTGDVRFFVNGERVLEGTTFDMSGYTSGLQCFMQLEKAANTNVDAVTLDYFRVICRRPV